MEPSTSLLNSPSSRIPSPDCNFTGVAYYIGAKVTRSVAGTIVYLWPYVIVFVFLYFIFCLLAGFIMSKITKIDRITAVFSCTPAGASDMALIASEFVTTTPTIATLQLVRMVGIIAIFPSMIALILRLYP
jgi:membrane AbrB-like protein